MRGSVFQRCACRDPQTRKLLHGRCPQLGKKGHGAWWFRYDAPRGADEKRRQPIVGPFGTKREAEEELTATLARIGAGGPVQDRSLTVGVYLTAYIDGKIDLKSSTWAANKEAIDLYWKPALGHLRLVDLRDHHIAEAVREIRAINRPDGERASEMLRRLVDARAESTKRKLAPGEQRRKKSVKPLSPARIRRVVAVLHAALNAAVPGKIALNPCHGVNLPRGRRVRPLPWTAERVAAFRAELEQRLAVAKTANRGLTTVERQRLWADKALRPSPVMVWLPQHTGAFLDFIERERLYAMFSLVAHGGLRRGEVIGLSWADVDLEQGVAFVRETGDGDDPKSQAGVRPVPMPASVVAALRAWRKRQAADRLSWGPDWLDTGRVFTREDGAPLPPQWVSVRFETLAYRAGLPPVRFHDLRHGAASLCKAAKLDTKFISALLGHSRSSFTDDTYVHVFPEVAKAAAEAAAAVVPRTRRGSA